MDVLDSLLPLLTGPLIMTTVDHVTWSHDQLGSISESCFINAAIITWLLKITGCISTIYKCRN